MPATGPFDDPSTTDVSLRATADAGAAGHQTAVRVVGIGASAGGLEAFQDLLAAIPDHTGMAFVLVQHLDPRHDSLLADILAGASAIPVVEVVDGMTIEPDHVYVIPPDAEMTIHDDVLQLERRTAEVPHRPLDRYFQSLAEARNSRAIGVVLSGNDADGAAGLQAIRDAGGITFVQTPESAKFAVMPRAAAAAADFVLPADDIAKRLVSIARLDPEEEGDAGGASVAEFDRILELLRLRHPVDFSHFKRGTIERRIRRRVLLGDHADVASYADSLQSDQEAVETLYQDLLIGVTSFFRDPSRFEALKSVVFPSIVLNRTSTDSVRLWVAGCSTGEEVYSLGIALLEFLDARADAPKISIYGTDINTQSLRKARTALYSEAGVRNIEPERLARFFKPVAGGFKIDRVLRDSCVFAEHDVTRDPPYSNVDLVTCCNVLIYFDPQLQKKAVSLLQYAVAPGGFLMLGSSENLRGATSELAAISTKPLIYQKRLQSGPRRTMEVTERSHSAPAPASIAATWQSHSVAPDEDDAFLARQLAPCGVLINDQMEITRIRGEVAPFIALEPGEASLNLFRLVRHHEVLAVLRPAVRRAMRERAPVSRRNLLVLDGEDRRLVGFDVIPFSAPAGDHAGCWVIFHGAPAPAGRAGESDVRRSEIHGLRAALKAAIDDRELLASEASAVAEEAQSSDEELRSTNEELETAKEELQSANEELSTLNDELRVRNRALVRMNDDIENLLGAVEIPILFVGTDLCVRRYNVTAGRLLGLGRDALGVRSAKRSRISTSLNSRSSSEPSWRQASRSTSRSRIRQVTGACCAFAPIARHRERSMAQSWR